MPPRSILLPLVALGLLLSVPLKAWTIVSAHGSGGAEPEEALARILDEAGFTTRFEDRILGRPAVVGARGTCRLWMAYVSGEGWHRDIVVSSASPREDVAFFFRGRAYADQPAWATWLDEKSAVLARSFAVPLRPSPVIAAHIGAGCDFDRGQMAERLGRF